MQRFLPVIFFLVLLWNNVNAVPGSTGKRDLVKQHLLFVENRGQITDTKGKARPDILFTAHQNGVQVFITATGIHYQFTKVISPTKGIQQSALCLLRHTTGDQTQAHICRLSVSLEGANPEPEISKELPGELTENFYLDHCPQGIVGVGSYGRIVMHDVYPGIDWVISCREQKMKYDFVVHPGAKPAHIRLKVADAENAAINGSGELVMKTQLGQVVENAPVSFSNGRQIATRFVRNTNGSFGFDLDKYDAHQPLTIDPLIAWATYYGGKGSGGGNEYGHSCSVDDSGNVYVSGITNSTAFTTHGAYDTLLYMLNSSAFLLKFDSSGNLKWATYVGGNGGRGAANGSFSNIECCLDRNGNVYVTGLIDGTGAFTTPGTYQPVFGGSIDAFLVKFNAGGARIWGTYYGGSGAEWGTGVSTDGVNNVYLSGYTTSTTGIASPGAHQSTYGGGTRDAFLVKLDSNGTRLWATYYGGAAEDYGNYCAAEKNGNVCLVGRTQSTAGIATIGSFQPSISIDSYDAFVAKFSSNGVRLWGTYCGGNKPDEIYGASIDGAGNVYVTGLTLSDSGIASPGAYQTAKSAYENAFLVKFDSVGVRKWATYYGGDTSDRAISCVAAHGLVYIAGYTSSANGIATAGSHQSAYGGRPRDAFLVQFDSTGTRRWATYYGGSSDDLAFGCAVDKRGGVYLTGGSFSPNNIATPGSYQSTNNGVYDVFVAKFYGEIIKAPSSLVQNSEEHFGELSLYPNPNNGHFTLKAVWDDALVGNEGTIELYNAMGQRLYHTKRTINCKEWATAIYFDSVTAPGLYKVRVTALDLSKALPLVIKE